MRLASVVFVADSVQLVFDSARQEDAPTLSYFVLPEVVEGDKTVRSDAPGWAGALVSLIGRDVTATTEGPGTGLVVTLGDSAIALRPKIDELAGPEIAMLRGFGEKAWMVWRAGEEAFEYLQ